MTIDPCFRAGIIELRTTWKVLRARKKRESCSRRSDQVWTVGLTVEIKLRFKIPSA